MKIANKRSFDDIGDFIFVSDEPVKADLILIPGAPIKELGLHGAKLYNEGYAPKILATGKYYFKYESLQDEFEKFSASSGDWLGQETEADYLKTLMLGEGVPEEAMILERESMSTFENAINAKKVLETEFKDNPVKHIILCCQAFHARRALMTFQSELRDIKITVCPVVTRGISRETWMNDQKSYNLILGELSKCGDYFKQDRMYEIR
ncbi:MAG: YdcF family protein [Butyrivibrio sp.]|nr:YdcF family protein [Butyrivibrio sp.]